MNNRLTRDRQNAILGGVCAGIGRYLSLDPVWVRIFFIILGAASGIGLMLYLLLWIIMPQEGQTGPTDFSQQAGQMGSEIGSVFQRPNPQARKYVGIGLIAIGLVVLVENLHIPWLAWFDKNILWALLLVIGGAVLLIRSIRGE